MELRPIITSRQGRFRSKITDTCVFCQRRPISLACAPFTREQTRRLMIDEFTDRPVYLRATTRGHSAIEIYADAMYLDH